MLINIFCGHYIQTILSRDVCMDVMLSALCHQKVLNPGTKKRYSFYGPYKVTIHNARSRLTAERVIEVENSSVLSISVFFIKRQSV